MRDFRIVVVAHGPLATAFLASAELILGPLDDAMAVGLDPADSPETFRDRLLAAAGDPRRPTLILTDLVGGTPHNVALAATRALPDAVVISGLNLAVLIEAATSLDALDGASIERLVDGGRSALVDATALLAARR